MSSRDVCEMGVRNPARSVYSGQLGIHTTSLVAHRIHTLGRIHWHLIQWICWSTQNYINEKSIHVGFISVMSHDPLIPHTMDMLSSTKSYQLKYIYISFISVTSHNPLIHHGYVEQQNILSIENLFTQVLFQWCHMINWYLIQWICWATQNSINEKSIHVSFISVTSHDSLTPHTMDMLSNTELCQWKIYWCKF